ncbi:hypothetical protein GCM10020254_18150 [Streptomyces goshikiensis]
MQDLYSVAYERSYRGLPVVGGDAVVLADGEGKVRAVQSASARVIDVATTPTVTAKAAEATSRSELAKVDKVLDSRLVVRLKDDKQVLAWETVLSGRTKTAPSKLHVFVDARTGKVVDRHDEVVAGSGTSKWNGPNPLTIDTTAASGTYSLRDPNRPGLSCADYSTGSVFSKSSDSWGTGNATSKETGCTDLMFAAQKQWNMLSQWLGRNGVDGNGRSFPGKVGLSDLNAYWDGSSVTIGRNSANEWIAGIDVVGHEYGHAIDSNTPGGTSGQESGLGEGTGDIFGALTEAYANEPAPYDVPDYTVGEMINLQGRGPIRNMYNPPAVNNDPACYSSAIPGTEVHAAAGPLNHWFYLLAEGTSPGGGKPSSPTCNSSTLTGVGVQSAGKIFYGGMLLKTSGMSYKKYRTATLSSAKSLDPTTCNLFNKTKAAWDAISVPAQSGDPTCTPERAERRLLDGAEPGLGHRPAGRLRHHHRGDQHHHRLGPAGDAHRHRPAGRGERLLQPGHGPVRPVLDADAVRELQRGSRAVHRHRQGPGSEPRAHRRLRAQRRRHHDAHRPAGRQRRQRPGAPDPAEHDRLPERRQPPGGQRRLHPVAGVREGQAAGRRLHRDRAELHLLHLPVEQPDRRLARRPGRPGRHVRRPPRQRLGRPRHQ